MQQAEEALRQMEMEVNTMPALRSSLAPKLKQYRQDMVNLNRELLNQKESLQRDDLLGSNDGSGLGVSREHRTRLLETNDRLRNSSKQLDEAKRTALETEEIGIDIMGDLRSQRE